MAFNKSKALESALKYLNQGKVSQAIAEYQQILRHDAKDQATLMTVGDLFARQGDMAHALEYFERLAEVYLNDGFNSKAIAIYKKIAKLAPAELPPLERLADLYVQQGVLSEARPLFLQIAEAHLKANRAPKAVEVLHRLLEVEPENPRVQMRLAELYNVMGQKKDAAKTYLAYGQRLFDRSDTAEAEKLVDRALEVFPADSAATLLKARILAAAGKESTAIKILEKHPEADAGSDVTNFLVDLELKTGQTEKAADRARNQLVRGNAHFGLLFRVTEMLVENGQAKEAIPLFEELRDPMIEAGEHDRFVKSLSAVSDRLPGNAEVLEMLADFCRHASDPFPLTVALTKLADIYAASGNDARAEKILEELVDRNKGDERLVERLKDLRLRGGTTPKPGQGVSETTVTSAVTVEPEFLEKPPAPAPAPVVEDLTDPETQRYVTQALTDVDLFSSYGLTQKAVNLLESVLQRAPRHTPALERLLDLSLGAGNGQRTTELAALLEEIHRERGDSVNADRFTELRQRFQKVAGITDQELKSTLTPVQSQEIEAPPAIPQSAEAGPPSISAAPARLRPESQEPPPEFEIPLASIEQESEDSLEASPQAELQAISSNEEVDLSDEWEAMVQEVKEPPPVTIAEEQSAPESIHAAEERTKPILEPELAESPEFAVEEAVQSPPEPESNLVEIPGDAPVVETGEFELELAPELGNGAGAATTEDFINELVAEVEGMEAPEAKPQESFQPERTETLASATTQSAESDRNAAASVPDSTGGGLDELSEVFQEFRSELGELGEEDEDLETHYNLGIAYREMGLLEEAIGEFQKVAKAVQKGKPFSYAMNCASLLALSFREKGEPKIASLWYQRALAVPGLDQEAVLALRYDLGTSLELAGESEAALDCFRQVYAMNIDYRDVADRISTLQHH